MIAKVVLSLATARLLMLLLVVHTRVIKIVFAPQNPIGCSILQLVKVQRVEELLLLVQNPRAKKVLKDSRVVLLLIAKQNALQRALLCKLEPHRPTFVREKARLDV